MRLCDAWTMRRPTERTGVHRVLGMMICCPPTPRLQRLPAAVASCGVRSPTVSQVDARISLQVTGRTPSYRNELSRDYCLLGLARESGLSPLVGTETITTLHYPYTYRDQSKSLLP